MINTYLIILSVGILLIFTGLVISKYPKAGWYLFLKDKNILTAILESKVVNSVLSLFEKNKKGILYRTSKTIIDYTESDISIKRLYFYKIISLIMVIISVIVVRYTNLSAIKQNIIAKPAQRFSVFDVGGESDYQYNINLYNSVVQNIGKDALKRFTDDEKRAAIKKVLPTLMNTNNPETLSNRVEILVDTINRINGVQLFDWKAILVFILSMWIPEILLMLKRLFLTSLYRKEIIRMENIFELLGNIPEIKTSQIIEEMRNSTRAYKKHLNLCLEQYSQDKKIALETMKKSVKNKRFTNLVDTIRIFSLVDRKTAMTILTRNKKDKEEDSLLLSEEDIEMSDIIALLSITPIIYEILNLLLKPMVDMSFEAFKLLG
mgnify:CR=1 FL=1